MSFSNRCVGWLAIPLVAVLDLTGQAQFKRTESAACNKVAPQPPLVLLSCPLPLWALRKRHRRSGEILQGYSSSSPGNTRQHFLPKIVRWARKFCDLVGDQGSNSGNPDGTPLNSSTWQVFFELFPKNTWWIWVCPCLFSLHHKIAHAHDSRFDIHEFGVPVQNDSKLGWLGVVVHTQIVRRLYTDHHYHQAPWIINNNHTCLYYFVFIRWNIYFYIPIYPTFGSNEWIDGLFDCGDFSTPGPC